MQLTDLNQATHIGYYAVEQLAAHAPSNTWTVAGHSTHVRRHGMSFHRYVEPIGETGANRIMESVTLRTGHKVPMQDVGHAGELWNAYGFEG